MRYPVISTRIYHNYPESWKKKLPLQMKIIKFITTYFEIQKNQFSLNYTKQYQPSI